MPRWQFMASSRWHARDQHLHIVGYRGLAVMTPKASTERTSECPRRALAALHVKVGSQPSAWSAASWPMVTDAANRRRGIMPDVRRREFILFPTELRPLGRARRAQQSPRGYRRIAAVTHLWRLTAALTATILLGSLLSSGVEARIRVECVRSSNPPNRPDDHNGPATVIAERRPDAHGDFGRSVVSVPARPRIHGSEVRHRIRVRGCTHAGLGR
jgi:hypothetical protein